MANFFLAYPKNRYAVEKTIPSVSDYYHYYNLLGGSRASQFKTSSAASATFSYKFSAAETISCLFIAEASEIISSDWSSSATSFSVSVDSSSDGSSWTTRGSESNIDSFIGVTDSDYLLSFTGVSAQYWRVVITPDANSEFKISKLFLCNAFNFSCDPDEIKQNFIQKEEPDKFLNGNPLSTNNYRNMFKANYIFTGVTDSKFSDFLQIMSATEPANFVIFNTSDNLQLSNYKAVYGALSDLTFNKIFYNYNQVSFDFNE